MKNLEEQNNMNVFTSIQNRSAMITSGFVNKPKIVKKEENEDDIEKAIVHSHQRKSKSGKLSQVKEYEDKRQKKYLNEKTDFNKFKDKEGDFYCSFNNLTSLEGAPKIVEGDFYCFYNNLTSLEGAPKIVKGDFYCGHNKVKFTVEDVKKVCKVSGIIIV